MKKIVWKITRVTNREGVEINSPDVQERKNLKWLVYHAKEGRSAIFLEATTKPFESKTLRTSTVEELILFDASMQVTTRNSVYWLEQSIEDVE
ncbi:hypothetical protein PQE70_gp177 [Bacillus phage vB_BanS_Nate]|uniref:Uncharacterized protein n=1 Tax=Bacillus phage vB_BanS_Nate TaxID=2894788 RepID=A0AAE9CDR7_9CAUD|nr:hypothetical protein PQE70_gp177 [Bacillus phage vB_BanS_Nate]UGO51030.1 hypothetical protein NATE_177 [Bacillus phage vB_BanS_Nate]